MMTDERLFSGWLGREQLGSDNHEGKARRLMKMMIRKKIHPIKARDYSAVGWALNNIAQLVKARRDD